MDLLERAKILLKATKELLEKQEDSCYVLNLLAETVFYDGVDCDGTCLKDDIGYWFDELEDAQKVQQWNTTPPTKNTYDILLSVKTENEEPHIWMGSYENGHYYYVDGYLEVDDEIVAWMPPPKPYKAEMESEEQC